MPIDPGQQRMGSGVVCFLRVILLLPGDTQKTTTTRRTRAAWAVLHPVPHTYRLLCLLAVCLSTKLCVCLSVLLAPSCALARRRRGSGAVSVRARGAPQSSRHLPAEGQRPRVDHGRGSTAGSVSARAWRERPGGSGWMRRRRTSAARPHDSSRAHARPLCSQPTSPGRSARAGAWGGCGPRLVERAAEPEV